MRNLSSLGSIATGVVSIALIAGCSVGGSPASAPNMPLTTAPGTARQAASGARGGPLGVAAGQPGVASPDALSATVYVSESSNVGTYSVTAFDKEGKQLAQLTNLSGAGGLAGDRAGNVYIANPANSGSSTVLEYDKTLGTLLTTLNDPGFVARAVAVDSKTGLVAVTNYANAAGGRGDVAIYAKGATTPCTSVTDVGWRYFGEATFDAKGHLYIDGFDFSDAPLLGVITGGCKAYKLTTLTVTGGTLQCPTGMQFTSSGNVAILDSCHRAVYTFAPPSNGAFGPALTSTPLTGTATPASLSFSKGDGTLWEADSLHNNVEQFAFPAGGSPIETITPPMGEYVDGVYVNPDSQV